MISSVTGKLYHTPFAPDILLSPNAMGIITTIYRANDIYKEGIPFPKPSNAPEQVRETADTKNPRLITCSAVIPI